MTYAIDTNKTVSEIFPDEAVIVDLASGAYYSFKGSAIAIWEFIGAGYSDQDIREHFNETETVSKFIEFLLSEKLITPADAVVKKTLSFNQPFVTPAYTKYDDMKDLLLLDPIHEVDQTGWPHKKPE